MNTALMFSSKSDEWSTPQDTFDALHAEFGFEVDLAATAENAKVADYFDMEADALSMSWSRAFPREYPPFRGVGFCNPPYSRGLQGKFIAKAAAERRNGFTTVMLIPARTDTKAFHEHIWDREHHRPRQGIEVRFLKGRLKFGGCKDSAPFPSMVVIFRPEASA